MSAGPTARKWNNCYPEAPIAPIRVQATLRDQRATSVYYCELPKYDDPTVPCDCPVANSVDSRMRHLEACHPQRKRRV